MRSVDYRGEGGFPLPSLFKQPNLADLQPMSVSSYFLHNFVVL